ncbi:MAG: oxidoreductase family protein [Verrucomicrobiota bacterium]
MKLSAPKTIDDIDVGWLTAALCENGFLEADNKVVSFERKILGEARGFLSCVAHYCLSFDNDPGPEAPSSLVVKIETDSEAYREISQNLHAFEREIKFYQTVAPEAPIRLAKTYATVCQPPNYAIVMEDLSHCTPGDQLIGMPYQQVEKLAAQLAQFQAKYWENELLAALDWMPTDNEVELHFQEHWPSFVEHYGEMIGPAAVTAGERMAPHMRWIHDELQRAPKTVMHFDLREDNMLFGPIDTEDEFIIVDWQLTIRGCGAYDVARIMSGSETPEQRRGHQVEICKVWHEALLAHGVTGYSFEDALYHFKLSVMATCANPVNFHKAVLTKPEGRTPLLMKALSTRCFDAVLELDATELLPD